MQVAITDLKKNPARVIALTKHGVVEVTKHGIVVARILPPEKKKTWVDDITGVIPDDGMTVKEIREARRTRYEDRG